MPSPVAYFLFFAEYGYPTRLEDGPLSNFLSGVFAAHIDPTSPVFRNVALAVHDADKEGGLEVIVKRLEDWAQSSQYFTFRFERGTSGISFATSTLSTSTKLHRLVHIRLLDSFHSYTAKHASDLLDDPPPAAPEHLPHSTPSEPLPPYYRYQAVILACGYTFSHEIFHHLERTVKNRNVVSSTSKSSPTRLPGEVDQSLEASRCLWEDKLGGSLGFVFSKGCSGDWSQLRALVVFKGPTQPFYLQPSSFTTLLNVFPNITADFLSNMASAEAPLSTDVERISLASGLEHISSGTFVEGEWTAGGGGTVIEGRRYEDGEVHFREDGTIGDDVEVARRTHDD